MGMTPAEISAARPLAESATARPATERKAAERARLERGSAPSAISRKPAQTNPNRASPRGGVGDRGERGVEGVEHRLLLGRHWLSRHRDHWLGGRRRQGRRGQRDDGVSRRISAAPTELEKERLQLRIGERRLHRGRPLGLSLRRDQGSVGVVRGDRGLEPERSERSSSSGARSTSSAVIRSGCSISSVTRSCTVAGGIER